MNAGEAKPYIDSVRNDLAQEVDPQLRNWYETELSFTPEYQEAATLQEKLSQLRGLLSQVTERAVDTQEAAGEPLELLTSEADEIAEIEEYVTPEEKKRRSVLSWLDTVVEGYQNDRAVASREPKRSRREKHEALAVRRFGRNFERFGDKDVHIVHDPDALAVVLEQLGSRAPLLAESVIKNSEAYMHQHGVEFAKDAPAFAKLIQHSTDTTLGPSFDRVFAAIYEKTPFLQEPEKAASLYISLANAALETFDGKTHAFYHKVAETAYYRNDIIGPRGEFKAAYEAVSKVGIANDELLPLSGELWNARLTYGQFRQGFLSMSAKLDAASTPTNNQILAASRSLGRKYGDLSKLGELADVNSHDDYFSRPQHAEDFEVRSIDDEASEDIPRPEVAMPDRLRPYFYAADLFKKRKENIAPRGLAHDIISTTFSGELGVSSTKVRIIDIPISPGLAITLGTNVIDLNLITSHVNNVIISKLIDEHGDKLKASLYQGSTHEQIARFGELVLDVSLPDLEAVAMVLLRPSVPDDRLLAGGVYSSMITSIRQEARHYIDPQEAFARHEAKLNYISQNRNHYPGRRPIRFRLPEHYRERGLQAIEIRQHPDRSNLYVSAIHEEGRVEFLFDEHFRINDPAHQTEASSALMLAFQDLVITLVSEWCCQPVVETSEGTVSVHDAKSRVNLGYLRYLPTGQGFSDRQRKVFAKEQRGRLGTESLRRKAIDPEGLGRNSTYVRENFDPSRPPLEIYYDPSVIASI